jgi:hypothetical protein
MTSDEIESRLAMIEALAMATTKACLAACFSDPNKLATAVDEIRRAVLGKASAMAVAAEMLNRTRVLEGVPTHAWSYSLHLSDRLAMLLEEELVRQAVGFAELPVEGSA